MNRGFRFYFAQAMRASCKSLWKKGNILKYLAYFIMSVLSLFTLVSPMFCLAGFRQAKIAARENTIDIPQSFKVACRAKPFFTMVLAILLETLIFLAGLILIGIGSALLGSIGYIISNFVTTVAPNLIVAIFLAPGGIVALVYSIVMAFLFAPTAYVIETNPDIGAANAISICINTMKSRGKMTCFLSCLVTGLIECAVLGAGVAVEYVLIRFVNDLRLYMVLAVIAGIIFTVAFALIAPMFALARKITLNSLFEDIVLDPVNASKRTSGVNIRRCKGVKFDPAEYENELTALFDETYTDRIPVPETDRARRKRELAERKAAKAMEKAPAQPEPPAITEPQEPSPAPAQPEPPAITEPQEPAPAPAKTAATDEEEDGELLTVSDLIRDVEPSEPPATAVPEEPAPAPAEPEPPATAVPEETAPAPAEPEPSLAGDNAETVKEEVKEAETSEKSEEVQSKPKRKTAKTASGAKKTKKSAKSEEEPEKDNSAE